MEYVKKLIHNFSPNEVLFNKSKYKQFIESFGSKFYTYGVNEWVFNCDFALDKIKQQFHIKSLKGFGIEKMNLATISSGVILHYLNENLNAKTDHIKGISRINQDDYVWLDQFTIKSLELVSSDHSDATTLLDIIDQTITPMGGRMLRKWTILPLKDLEIIKHRHFFVEQFVKDEKTANSIRSILQNFGDIERIISKISVGKVSPKELLILKESIKATHEIENLIQGNNALLQLMKRLSPLHEVAKKIETEIYPEAPAVIGKGRLISDGVNSQLDEYRAIATNGKELLLNLQKREIEKTSIPSLKIAFNNVFGYYLEVRNTHKDKVPKEWIRKQTLVNAERYITQELKELETKILSAEEKIGIIELKVFKEVIESICLYLPQLQLNAETIAELDCLLGFAKIAADYNYCKPVVDDSLSIDIKEGRHPVIEHRLPRDEKYVSNDVYLDNSSQQIIMVTGPNMAGKSALLRQTALITLMAQMGSFVSASEAKIGFVDRVFTRVGASDNISTGASTFIVEMYETSNILNNLYERSLIILDEIGRGTSTYDGVSIAWAISEYLHEYPLYKPKTLFATHYHELNKMTEQFTRIKNYNVAVKEINNKVIFMRKLVKGGSQHSFGIHVAKLAGMPNKVVERANEVLGVLEQNQKSDRSKNNPSSKKKNSKTAKISMFN